MDIFDEYQPKFSVYRSLMGNRIRRILLVSTLYDAFVIEEDGSISEQIWSQYVGRRLSDPPEVKRVSRISKALAEIEKGKIDLILAMPRLADGDPFAFAAEVKKKDPDLPFILLVTDPAELSMLPPEDERKSVDKIFLWNNDPQILLAIIKVMEDRLNVDFDTMTGQVRTILVVDDSIAHYSSFLPIMYTVIMDLTRSIMDDGLNDLHKQLRMRSRAKILLAETYEEAIELYRKHRDYMLGVISDVRFPRNGALDPEAGFDLIRSIRAEEPGIPVVLQSAEPEKNRQRAQELKTSFIDKNSPSLFSELRKFMKEQMGFGKFVFRLPDGHEVGSAGSVYEFLDRIQDVPIESLIWHAERNHISNWLMARSEITMSDQLRHRTVNEFDSHEDVRNYIVKVISEVLSEKQDDVVAKFSIRRPATASGFMVLGSGSMGGKGRGIAFMRYMARKLDLNRNFPHIDIAAPPTLVVGADEFDTFLDDNDLKQFSLECEDLNQILKRFSKGELRTELVDALRYYLLRVKKPLAVRSSSILEDSHHQPFAGLYSTYMLPNNSTSESARLAQLLQAIRVVWASTYGPDPKAYFESISHRIEEEKMAVVIQELIGRRHGDAFYPTLSGVGQSYNFYPFGPMKAEEGIANLALGLGKTVVEGGVTLRFNPAHPQVLPQFYTPKEWLNNSQKQFWALKLERERNFLGTDPDESLELLELSRAEADGELDGIASVYSHEDEVIRDSLSGNGPRILTFANILKYNEFPLGELLSGVFDVFRRSMGCPVEIEFAANMRRRPRKSEFKVLQLRPLIASSERGVVEIDDDDRERAWAYTAKSLGNGKQDTIRDIVYVRPETFDRSQMQRIAYEVSRINKKLSDLRRRYILLGFGRWGSNDRWLGIGVKWSQISHAKILMEASLPDFSIDPSQGSHFFQNITSLGIGYLTIQPGKNGAFVDWDWLKSQAAEEETDFLRHLYLPKPVISKIDGRKREAALIKPDGM